MLKLAIIRVFGGIVGESLVPNHGCGIVLVSKEIGGVENGVDKVGVGRVRG